MDLSEKHKTLKLLGKKNMRKSSRSKAEQRSLDLTQKVLSEKEKKWINGVSSKLKSFSL